MPVTSTLVSFFRSIRGRIALCVVIATIPVGLFAVWDAQRTATAIRADVTQDAEARSLLITRRIQDRLDGARETLELLSRQPEIRFGDMEACGAALASYLQIFRARYTTFGLNRASLPGTCTPDWRPGSPVRRLYDDEDRLRNPDLVTRMLLGTFTRKPTVIVSKTVHDAEGVRTGLLGVGLDLEAVTRDLMPLADDGSYAVFIVNDDGAIYGTSGFRPEKPMQLGTTRLSELDPREEVARSSVDIIPGGLHVIITKPQGLIAKRVAGQIWGHAFYFLFGLAITVLALLWVVRSAILVWINAIADVIGRLSRGERNVRISMTPDDSELGQLAGDVDRLSQTLHEKERLLEETETRLYEALELIDDGFAIFDSEDRLILWNSKYEIMYDRSRKAIRAGVTFEELIREGVANGQYIRAGEDPEGFIADRMAAHRFPKGAIEQELPNGRWMRVREFRSADGSTVGLRTNITDLKRRELMLERQSAELASYAHLASHDLQEPLRKISTYCGILRDACAENDVEERERALDVILRASQTGRNLVSDLLRYSKLRDRDIARAPFDLSQVVMDVVEQVSDTRTQDTLTVDVPLTPVMGDAALIRQVVQNLIGNALKYRKRGEPVTINVILREAINGSLVLAVRDTGIGFDPTLASEMFKPFKRLVAKSEYEGSGIGLALVASIIEKHGWAIEVESTPGVGSRFAIRIPGRDVVEAEAQQSQAA
jgi:signal transduction histidine kinase